MNIILFLFLLGAVLGALINFAADGLGWVPKYRSPWQSPRSRLVIEFVPIIGWLFRKKEAAAKRFSLIRPLVVELLAAVGTVALWHWEVVNGSLLPEGLQAEPFNTLVLRFAVHLVFFAFLAVASLTDIDDMVISDTLTATGTILGLIFAATLPQTLLPATLQGTGTVRIPGTKTFETHRIVMPFVVPLNTYSPSPPPEHRQNPFLMFCVLWWFWCFAMLPRVWYFKLPFRKAAAIFIRYLRRCPTTPYLLSAAVLVPAVFGFLYPSFFAELPYTGLLNRPQPQLGLLSALTGMAAGMAIIWGVRLVGSAVLGREAMGFGDVTLMGMIGAFTGWQCCILIFFLAPFAGLFLGIFNALLGRGKEFPYGPFLCLATVFLIIAWKMVWGATSQLFELGWLVAAGMGVCLLMLGVMLGFWRFLRSKMLQ